MRSLLAAVLTAGLLLAACGGGGGSETPTATRPEPPATPQPSATAGPPSERSFQLTQIMEQTAFARMVAFVPLPGSPDDAIVATQDGVLWRVSISDAAPPVPFGDLSGRMIETLAFEEGFLGIAFSPEFATDGRVFVQYTAGDPRRNVLSSFAVRDGALDLASEAVVLEVEQPFPNHNGGALAFGPDGYLYVALGDGGLAGDPAENGQDLSTLLGSILRLDVSDEGYQIPPDNPFADTPGARPEIYAYGLRNPWRMSFDREAGELWTGDVGQGDWEETDRVVAGGNYGWNLLEGRECFAIDPCDDPGLLPPRSAYEHGEEHCAVIGGSVYRGTRMPELRGWYVYADFCSGVVWAVDAEDDGEPIVLLDSVLAFSSFGELPDGELVLLAYESVGDGVYLLEPRD